LKFASIKKQDSVGSGSRRLGQELRGKIGDLREGGGDIIVERLQGFRPVLGVEGCEVRLELD